MANIIQSFPKGSGKGGHTILDNGTAITDRATLNLTDFDIVDDSTNLETDITPHELTSEELAEIMSNAPAIATLSAHQIVDKNDVALTQRRMLKFTGGATITDDSGNDTTVVNISGGSGDAGHTIQDATGTDLTQRDTMQFAGDFEAEDDSTDSKTVVKPHELTNAEMREIVSTVPGSVVQFPVIIDERGTEYVIGKYILSDGTSKPLYEKTLTGTTPAVNGEVETAIIDANLEYAIVTSLAIVNGNAKSISPGSYNHHFSYWVRINNKLVISPNDSETANHKFIATVRYTKTTDTPE